MTRPSKHPPEFDARIISGYAANERVRDIAKDLAVTRNTVIGRARRLGLADPTRPRSIWPVDEAVRKRQSETARRRHKEDPGYHAKSIAAMHAGLERYRSQRRAKAVAQ